MHPRQAAPRAQRRTHTAVRSVILLIAAATSVVGCSSLVSSSATPSAVAETVASTWREHLGGLKIADGEVPTGVTVDDGQYPAVDNLDPALRTALRQAAEQAKNDGVDVYLNSGWRSPAHQDQLLEEAVSKYGSRAEAARWVATPTTSQHVSGDAVDLGRSEATRWLARHGAAFGLCQIYRNEPWHFELRPGAAQQGCPARYADPTHDPRMLR